MGDGDVAGASLGHRQANVVHLLAASIEPRDVDLRVAVIARDPRQCCALLWRGATGNCDAAYGQSTSGDGQRIALRLAVGAEYAHGDGGARVFLWLVEGGGDAGDEGPVSDACRGDVGKRVPKNQGYQGRHPRRAGGRRKREGRLVTIVARLDVEGGDGHG